MPILRSQIAAQDQGERVEGFPSGGVPPLGCRQDSPLAIKVLKALVSKFQGGPEAGTALGTLGAEKQALR